MEEQGEYQPHEEQSGASEGAGPPSGPDRDIRNMEYADLLEVVPFSVWEQSEIVYRLASRHPTYVSVFESHLTEREAHQRWSIVGCIVNDDRQVARGLQCMGPKGRWRSTLSGKIADSIKGSRTVETACEDYKISPVVRQTLQHWGYRINPRDLVAYRKRTGR